MLTNVRQGNCLHLYEGAGRFVGLEEFKEMVLVLFTGNGMVEVGRDGKTGVEVGTI